MFERESKHRRRAVKHCFKHGVVYACVDTDARQLDGTSCQTHVRQLRGRLELRCQCSKPVASIFAHIPVGARSCFSTWTLPDSNKMFHCQVASRCV
jgi:hypothetical protein